MNKTLANPYYLFSFQHIASKERISFIPEVITSNVRYDKFRFKEGGNVNLQSSPPEVWFGNYLGQYYYSIYEQLSPTNTDIDLTYNKLESGRAWVIVGDDNTQECFFEPYISNDEDFAQVIYVSEEEQFCISGDTTPVCPSGLTGSCPTYITRYSPLNSIYYKDTGTTASFLSSLDTCAPVQVAFDDTRMFMVDGCSNYYQYNYTITSGGCFNLTFVNKWDVWESSGTTPNASYSLGIYDSNNLIIGESASFVEQTGSTLYLYNLTTSGLTKWLEIGNSAQVYNIYYNTGNTQTVLTYGSASGGTGYYQLYSGSTNPQLIGEIPITISIGGSTMYFSGNTAIAVNVAGLQFPLDFVNGTMYLWENSSGIPINYVDFGDGFDYLSNISQPASCYTFDIPYIPPIPPTPSITPTMTPTPTTTITPTITPTMTPTPSSTPSAPQTPQTLGATWWIDFTDASTLVLNGSIIDTAYDKIANIPFTATTGQGPFYNSTGYLGISGTAQSNAAQLRNSSGEYTQIGDYTWFVRIYDDPSAQRGGKIIVGAANPGWPIGLENLLMIDNNSNPYPPGPVWIFQNDGVIIDGNISFSTWTDIAMRAYHTGSTLTLEVWENGSITYTNSVSIGSPIIIADEIFSLMFDGGIDFATEQFFFNRALNTGEMAQMFNYLTNKY
jgi:hypothetical protein